MALWRDGAFGENSWTTLVDDAPAPPSGAILVSLARWRQEREAFANRADSVGVEIVAGKDALEHLAEVADRPLVALRFDKFADGRAFSYAILLRERHGFSGELRAVGDVLLDEIPLMLRCGFTAFEIVNAPTLRALEQGRLPRLVLAYQPGLAPGEAPSGTRPWLRRSGASVHGGAPAGQSSFGGKGIASE
jgi:phosphoadenosine phosphosulfate reductase